ncbi:hypothetical protein SUGI_0482350 [Cryptomeria japonica]|nr:hypothetical protein SUGI_0482350 [Cryptomeria japonica]
MINFDAELKVKVGEMAMKSHAIRTCNIHEMDMKSHAEAYTMRRSMTVRSSGKRVADTISDGRWLFCGQFLIG